MQGRIPPALRRSCILGPHRGSTGCSTGCNSAQFGGPSESLAFRPAVCFLDVGCGTGRWLRRYKELGLCAVGIDATLGMLRLAREKGTTTPLIVGEALSDVTVVQHIPYPDQPQALRETRRVLKPGGAAILMELIRGEGAHIFPRNPAGWTQEFTSCGAKLVGWFGQEFLLLDRLFVGVAQRIARRHGRLTDERGLPGQSPSPTVPSTRRAFWAIRRITVPVSAWTDFATAKIVPASLATHGVFVLRKS